MNHSPWDIYQHHKDMLAAYLDTTYKLSHPNVAKERYDLLQRDGVISRYPYIETTPRFEPGQKLRDLNPRLADLVQFGLPTEKFPLYKHQQVALQNAWQVKGTPGNLVVATGTGSGKTESFLLPILADILTDAETWKKPRRAASEGVYDKKTQTWCHSRSHETRPAAVRAIVLYPMNALVNDQLKRLRRILARDEAVAWQLEHLNGNLIHFGRYTGQTAVPGAYSNSKKQEQWQTYKRKLLRDKAALTVKQLASGGWPLPGGPEMLCRWDMQAAPPDILITNYSMLEYMLVRPIEASIFDETKKWLHEDPSRVLTLVLDEAHTYTGARGTEVSYLVRRLYERLQVSPERIRCIATSASMGEGSEGEQNAKLFASRLFGQDKDSFTIVTGRTIATEPPDVPPSLATINAFATFQNSFSLGEPEHAASALLSSLGNALDDRPIKVQLYDALKDHPQVLHVRHITARQAIELNQVAATIWGDLSSESLRRTATAGLLAAGSWARPEDDPEVPPLLPTRMHLMYRGLPGLWACIDPACSEVAEEYRDSSRPCGVLYAEPRVRCECGARVLELFGCHVCGLLHMGGVKDRKEMLWPYEPNLDGVPQQYEEFTVFAVEPPNDELGEKSGILEQFRSLVTTAPDGDGDGYRKVWAYEVTKTKPYPTVCPRCKSAKRGNRNIIEQHKTRGHQSFAVLVEDAFRLQPNRIKVTGVQDTPAADGITFAFTFSFDDAEQAKPPLKLPEQINPGRKVLAFSDGRQDAALLAADLQIFHHRDGFRQLLLSCLHEQGDQPLPVPALVDQLLELSISRGIDPTGGEVEGFWKRFEAMGLDGIREEAKLYLLARLRNEMAGRDIAIEAVGLARWVLAPIAGLNPEKIPPLLPLSPTISYQLVETVTRLLLTEDILLPPSLNPESWPSDVVTDYDRKLLVTVPKEDSQSLVWPPSRRTRLYRYLDAVAQSLGIQEKDSWVSTALTYVYQFLVQTKRLVGADGKRTGMGIPVAKMALKRMPDQVYRCEACGYLSADTVASVCIRCRGTCTPCSKAEAEERHNYYRELAKLATAQEKYPDPFPLRAMEHTGAISSEDAADFERYFQDIFLNKEGISPDIAELPADCRIDVLSVTTTMEMGIDIGDLTAVGLRNMPPSVASYQQRAGRAGRRSDGVAAVMTYALHRSHDQYYFHRVPEIVKGKVRIPSVYLENQVIVKRHINAVALQRFFRTKSAAHTSNLFASWGYVSEFLEAQFGDDLRAYLKSPEFLASISGAVRRILPTEMHGLVPDWLDQLPNDVERVIGAAKPEAEVLTVLINGNILPRYAFPIDVVALWRSDPAKFYNRGEEVQRDLQIGLSEFAPGAEIVMNHQIFQCVGLYTPYEEHVRYEPSGWYYECPKCRTVRVDPNPTPKPEWTACEVCRTSVGTDGKHQILPYIQPKGFCTDWVKKGEKYRGGGRDRAGYTTTAQLEPGPSVDACHTSFYDGRLMVTARRGNLSMVNYGPMEKGSPGFHICEECGRALKSPTEQHNRPTSGGHNGPSAGARCKGRANAQSILYHTFGSDVALIGVNLRPELDADARDAAGRALWYSFGTAVLRAAAVHLQIQPDELAVNIRAWQRGENRIHAEVFLYDTLPGGAGYARDISDQVEMVLEEAWKQTTCENPHCGGACYSCLLDYNNQRQHPLLDRSLARDMLRYILDGTVPCLTERLQVETLGPLKALLEQQPKYHYQSDVTVNGLWVPGIVDLTKGQRKVLWPIHNMWSETHPDVVRAKQKVEAQGLLFTTVRPFDLSRRPVWVWDNKVN